jgi:hypothetical protein
MVRRWRLIGCFPTLYYPLSPKSPVGKIRERQKKLTSAAQRILPCLLRHLLAQGSLKKGSLISSELVS